MAYNELVKNFEKIRQYMRLFYAYGFGTRNDITLKSRRSYDDERRRIESWLGEYVSFKQEESGKSLFISVDSRSISHNPFFRAFKAKSFTANDILLYFSLLDILKERELTLKEIYEILCDEYLSFFEDALYPDESTVRKKLTDYVKKGIIRKRKQGRSVYYRKAEDCIDLKTWADAVSFFSEISPTGVIGSYILDKEKVKESFFSFKHHYLVNALDSQVIYDTALAMGNRRTIEFMLVSRRRSKDVKHTVYPLKFLISTQNGRQYLLAREYRDLKIKLFRLDKMKKVKALKKEEDYKKFLRDADEFLKNMWGVSRGKNGRRGYEDLIMKIRVGKDEKFIVERLVREKRNGKVERIDENTWQYSVRCLSCQEMLPWIRTFTGRIVDLYCSDEKVTDVFYEDLAEMNRIYLKEEGGSEDV